MTYVRSDPTATAALKSATQALEVAKKAAAAIDGGVPDYDLGATQRKFQKLVDDSDLEAADAVRIGRDLSRTMEKVKEVVLGIVEEGLVNEKCSCVLWCLQKLNG